MACNCDDCSLEDLLSKGEELLSEGLLEAREQLNKGCPFTAGYTLFLMKDAYRAKNKEIPKEVADLQDEIDKYIKEKCPQKIREAIDKKNFKEAQNQFVVHATYYNRRKQKLPKELWDLRNQIAAGEDVDPIFAYAYPKRCFED